MACTCKRRKFSLALPLARKTEQQRILFPATGVVQDDVVSFTMIGVVGFVCAMAGGAKARPATMPAATPSLSLKWEKVVPSEVAEPLIWLSGKRRVRF